MESTNSGWRLSAYNPNATAEDRRQVIEGQDGRLVGVEVYTLRNGWGAFLDEKRKRAESLVLAAPDLLSALRAILGCPEMNWQETDDVTRAAIASARAALAKAEGRQA